MESRAKFKKGDKVRCISVCAGSSFKVGHTYTVASDVHADNDLVGVEGTVQEMYPFRFELVASVLEPRFKVGDRVRATGAGPAGEVGTVRFIDSDYVEYLIEFDTWRRGHGGALAGLKLGRSGYWLGAEDLEHATLTIQTGKCYRTRDGRKAGPMRKAAAWESWTDTEGRHGDFIAKSHEENGAGGAYAADGTWLTADDDCTRHNLIAEWIDEPAAAPKPVPVAVAGSNDNGPAPVAGQPAAKFKVGDRVRDVHATEITAVVRAILPGNRIQVEWDNYPGLLGTWSADGFELADTRTRSIVCLIENGQPKPADHPHVHASRSAAEREATRLAGKHKGKEFGVFELVSTKREAAPVYAHEWQRLAAEGRRIDAIKLYRETGGRRPTFVAATHYSPAGYEDRHVIGLAEAKDAVEHFLQAA